MAAVIGDPVRHSVSPAIHNAAFRSLDLDWVFVAFEVAREELADAIAGMRGLGIDGLSVTMPHKDGAAALVDRLTPAAKALGAVNCVAREGTVLVGDNTDGAGFIDALRQDEGFEPRGRPCAVLGAGGAARAIVHALAQAGAADVVVVNRTAGRGEEAAAMADGTGRVGTADDVRTVDLVVNATPVGMPRIGAAADDGDGELPIDPDVLRPGQVVVDLVYVPPQTLLLREARKRGATAVNGLGMLVHQAGHAFRRWTAQEPPLPAMSAAAIAAVAHAGRQRQ